MRWAWSAFGGGLVVGLVGVIGSYAMGRAARLPNNRWPAYVGFVAMTLGVATLAGLLRSGWIDVGFAAYVALANFALPLALLPRVRHASSAACSPSSSCGATACASCPLGERTNR
jgi:predicted MFS family arabinose efflux permease